MPTVSVSLVVKAIGSSWVTVSVNSSGTTLIDELGGLPLTSVIIQATAYMESQGTWTDIQTIELTGVESQLELLDVRGLKAFTNYRFRMVGRNVLGHGPPGASTEPITTLSSGKVGENCNRSGK